MLNTSFPNSILFNDGPWWSLIYSASLTDIYQSYFSDTNSLSYQSLVNTYAGLGIPIWNTLNSSRPGCADSSAVNYDPLALSNNGSCISPIFGCIDTNALNYDSLANSDDGTCTYSDAITD